MEKARASPNRTHARASDIQRGRIILATIEAVAEFGYHRLSVAAIIERAGVSRKTFYAIFVDREDCFLAACERALSLALEVVGEAYAQQPRWPENIRSALARLLVLVDEEPELARLWFLEAPRAEERVSLHRRQAFEEIAKVIDRGRMVENAMQPPAITAEGVVGSIFAVLHLRLLERSQEPFSDLLGSLMHIIVLPYLGQRAARRELDQPARRASRAKPERAQIVDSSALKALNIRVTYRTLLVLAVIGDRPDASNREIARHAGIADQGQISKLLNRLSGLELIENQGLGQDHGGANAWWLTDRGEQVVRTWGQWAACASD